MCLHMVAVKCAARVRLLWFAFGGLESLSPEILTKNLTSTSNNFDRSRFISFFANPIYTGILFFHACHNTQRGQRIATDRLTSKAP